MNEKMVLRKAGRVGISSLMIRKESSCENCDAPTNEGCAHCGMDICDPDSCDDCSEYRDGEIECIECKAERVHEAGLPE